LINNNSTQVQENPSNFSDRYYNKKRAAARHGDLLPNTVTNELPILPLDLLVGFYVTHSKFNK
jgi:hypothetical protein